jgi:protein SCO1/2
LIIVMALPALLLAGCGGSESGSSSTGASGSQSASSTVKYAGTAAVPSKAAPPLALRDSLGHPVNLDQYRGKAVFVTFIYDHCPDICPLMVGNLHSAQAQLGTEAQKLQIIAVSVDPRGDTPSTVKAFLREHRMTGRMEYLIGSRPELENVWRDWFILSKATPTPKDPDLVEHSALVYGISASGRITTLYSQDFVPAQIVHDVPILASQ